MSEFFATTEPLEKSQILEIFKDVLCLTKLFVAPFGLLHDAADILGEFVARKDYKSIHRCWEDFTARKVYSLKQVSDDCVAASLQYYLETKNDKEMMDAMKINERAVYSLLSPSRVVELPGRGDQEQDMDLEDLACGALLSVATAWKDVEDEFMKGMLSKSATAVAGPQILDVNTIHPCDIGYIVSFLSISTIQRLLTSLDNIPCISASTAGDGDSEGTGTVALSYEQYQALLDIYFRSPPLGPVSPRMQQLFASLDILLADPVPASASASNTASALSRRSSPLSVFYGGMVGGAGVFLRRLQALGWKQAMLFRDTRYLPSTAPSHTSSGSCGSPFSHPVLASLVYLEESLRVNAGGGSGDDEDVTAAASSSASTRLEEVYVSSMELLRVYNIVMKKRYSTAGGDMKSDQDLQEEEEAEAAGGEDSEVVKNSMLDVMFSVEEAISQFERTSKKLVTPDERLPLLDLHLEEVATTAVPVGICEHIIALFLFERAICRIKTEEVEEALEDINRALLIDPKCAVGYKSRFKIYSRMAMMRAEEEQDQDEDEEEEESNSDDEKVKPSSKTLLIRSAYDALAAFILDGSTNILLAGAAEDATREACRDEAKQYFWDRNDDSSDNDSDWSDEDEDGSAEDDDGEEKGVVCCEEVLKKSHSGGLVSTLTADVGGTCEEQEANLQLLQQILASSALPRSWLVNSYMTLFPPLNVAFDISLALIENMIDSVDDGLGEEVNIPYAYLLQDADSAEKRNNAKENDENECKEEAIFPKEGDADAFKLICTVIKALMKCKSQGKMNVSPSENNTAKLSAQSCGGDDISENNSSGKYVSVAFETQEEKMKDNNNYQGEPLDDGVEVDIWRMESLLEMTREALDCEGGSAELVESGCFASFKSEEGDVDIASAIHSMALDGDSSTGNNTDINVSIEATSVPSDKISNASSSYFKEAFSLISSSSSSALTGVVFKWAVVVAEESEEDVKDKEGEASDAPRFRLFVEVTDSVLAATRGDKDEAQGTDSEPREVSKRLRSRLLSLCGSIAYLCGDAMGGYKCLKASILLDDNLLDSRLKISSILLEMDELDKAEAQLTEAKHRPNWENDICLDLHLAELHLHRMEYFPAVRILRATSRRLDFLLQGWQGLAEEQETALHIGPTICSLHGVAEFRVTPETPLKALNILQKGIATFPDNVSLCVCYGEVLGQAGDPAGSLKSYADASELEPDHPLPYLNASRVYQQLNQMQLCKKHMKKAFDLDRSLSLTLVDIAQFKLHEKRFLDHGDTPPPSSSSTVESDVFFAEKSSEDILATAVEVSRHVSEVIDVFTARQIARFYAKLGASGLAPVFL